MKKSLFYLSLFCMFLWSCNNDDSPTTLIDPDPDPVYIPKLTNPHSISSTPFNFPRTAVVYQDNLYVIADNTTYKYSFSSNTWENVTPILAGMAGNINYFGYSFIHNNKWFFKTGVLLWNFDFSTNTWELYHNINNWELSSQHILYDEGALYIIREPTGKFYKYNVDTKSIQIMGDFNPIDSYGDLKNAVQKVGGEFYYAKVYGGNGVQMLKIVNNFSEFEVYDPYQTLRNEDGATYVFGDYLIFGLGGDIYGDGNGMATSYSLSDKFYFFNTATNTYGQVINSFYEKRKNGLPIQYNNKFYLLCGAVVENDLIIRRSTLDEFGLEIVQQ